MRVQGVHTIMSYGQKVLTIRFYLFIGSLHVCRIVELDGSHCERDFPEIGHMIVIQSTRAYHTAGRTSQRFPPNFVTFKRKCNLKCTNNFYTTMKMMFESGNSIPLCFFTCYVVATQPVHSELKQDLNAHAHRFVLFTVFFRKTENSASFLYQIEI